MQAKLLQLIISSLVPYLVDLAKYLINQITLKEMRKKKEEELKKAAAAVKQAQTDEDIKGSFEKL